MSISFRRFHHCLTYSGSDFDASLQEKLALLASIIVSNSVTRCFIILTMGCDVSRYNGFGSVAAQRAIAKKSQFASNTNSKRIHSFGSDSISHLPGTFNFIFLSHYLFLKGEEMVTACLLAISLSENRIHKPGTVVHLV